MHVATTGSGQPVKNDFPLKKNNNNNHYYGKKLSSQGALVLLVATSDASGRELGKTN